MLKQKLVKSVLSFLVIIIGLFFAGFISFLLSPHPELGKVQGIIKITNVSSPSPKSSIPTRKTKFKVTPYVIFTPTPTPSNSPETNSQSNSSEVQPVIETAPSPVQSPNSAQISVSINSSSYFIVSVIDGSSQCDVLSKALADGKISSLNMRYDSNFETYAIYQINGIGKENSVWWTYKVNGETPNQGCSFIKVKNEDSVEWKYIGS